MRDEEQERLLVLTADDLGRDPAGTAVIIALGQEGLISAATLLTVSEESPHAAARLREAGLTPRLHLALMGEADLPPWRPLSDGASLRERGGAMTTDPRRLARELDLDEAVEEFDAQLAWMRDRGLEPGAADFHTTALYGLRSGALLEATLRWCARHGLGFRLPRRTDPFPGTDALPVAARGLHAAAVHLADALGVPLPAALLSHHGTAPSLDALRAELTDGLARLPPGTSELVMHPSARGAGVPAVRELEARLLRDEQWREALRGAGFRQVPHW
ncbi:ChbG/HpnK family deacetylase [Brachybacterium sp. sponge]|uniref:ChbG/HpnK family deacetylase n=1 Tax=Brachybacterium sp. sponge TaxID=1775432 RepID=UPI0007A489FA|nr:ChbG/HpnK family deacetylase [Brachybacterium sp. sponge]